MMLTKSPTVTVLMTVYNGGEYLKSSVKSILNQTFKDFEFLIVNNCSTDNSLDIIESFNDSRIVIHNNEKNLGQTKALNIGLRLAKGLYVSRMDADDIAFPLLLEKTVGYMLKNPEYVAIGSAAIIIDSLGKIKAISKSATNFQEILSQIFFTNPMNHGGTIFNKEIILKNGCYNEKFMFTQDFELWSSLIRNNYKLMNMPNVLVAYRIHEKSSSNIEANTRVPTEAAETIYRNVKALSNMEISHDDVLEIFKFTHQTEKLTFDEFERAGFNLNRIYATLKDNFTLTPDIIRVGLRRLMLGPYCKYAIFEMKNGNIKRSRKIVIKYNREFGFNIIPFLIFITLLGKPARKIAQLYKYLFEKIREFKARMYFFGKSNLNA